MERRPEDDALRQDQVAIAGYFRLAFGQVSADLGGGELVAEVEALPTDAESMWPVNALRFLEGRYPGAAEAVFSRAEAIQDEVHATGGATE